MKNLIQRTISGVIYLIVVIGALFLGEYSYGALFLVISILALIEFYNINGYSEFDYTAVTGILAGILVFILSYLCYSGIIQTGYLWLTGLVPIVFVISGLYAKGNPLRGIRLQFFGFLYITLPLSATNLLAFPDENAGFYTHKILLGLLILIWINDTGAYVTGMLFGKRRLFPSVSPKKSWEGFAGGTAFTLAAAFIMTRLMGILNQDVWLVLAVIVSIFGVYGDLFESLIKRNADMKDSGTLIPGHGGVLDRFDSMLLVVPAALIYLNLRPLLF